MARALGVSPSTLSGWESGRDPAGEVRAKYAYLLDGLDAKLATETDTTAVPTQEQSVASGTAAAAVTAMSSPEPGQDEDEVELLAVPEPCVLCGRPAQQRVAGFAQHLDPCRLPGNTRRTPKPAPTAPLPGPRAAYSTPAPSGRAGKAWPRAGRAFQEPSGPADLIHEAVHAALAEHAGRRRSRGHRVAEAGDPGRDGAAGRDPQGRPLRRDRPPLDPRHPPEADRQGRRPDLGGPPQVDAARTTARQARGHRARHQRRLSVAHSRPICRSASWNTPRASPRPAPRRCPPDHPARLGARRVAAQPDRPARRTGTRCGSPNRPCACCCACPARSTVCASRPRSTSRTPRARPRTSWRSSAIALKDARDARDRRRRRD